MSTASTLPRLAALSLLAASAACTCARAEAMRTLREPHLAATDAVPRILREPPWLQADRPGELPALEIAPRTRPATVRWDKVDREAVLAPPAVSAWDRADARGGLTEDVDELAQALAGDGASPGTPDDEPSDDTPRRKQ